MSFPGRPREDAASEKGGAGPLGETRVHEALQVQPTPPPVRSDFIEYYDIVQQIGEGSFGDIFEACSKSAEAQQRRCFAVKIFRHTDKGSNSERQQSFEAETTWLSRFEHPHMVKMFECFQDGEECYIVLELCRGGDLFGRILNHSRAMGGGLEDRVSRVLFLQMLHAISYLHAQLIVHRDLKTENFLLLGGPGSVDENVLKICDFGSCVVLTPAKPRCMEKCGTLSYTAPEVYTGLGAELASDMWSLGVVLYVLMTGTNPFQSAMSASADDTIVRIRSGNFDQIRSQWLEISPSAQNLVRRLLVVDESKRLQCRGALRHQWLASSERPMLKSGLADPPGLASQVPRFLTSLWLYTSLAMAQRLALIGCAMAASEEDVLRCRLPCRDLFLALDADQDGRLGFEEFAQGLERLLGAVGAPLPAESVDKLQARTEALDVNRSGKIDWVEFLAVALLPMSGIFSKAVEPTSTALRLLDRPPAAYSKISGSKREKKPTEILTQWVSSDERGATLYSSFLNNGSAKSGSLTVSCLHFVLTSIHKMAKANGTALQTHQSSEQEEPLQDEQQETLLGLTISPVTAELLLVCAEDDSDTVVTQWNEACDLQQQPNKQLKVDNCIMMVSGLGGDAGQMMEFIDEALVSNRDDVRRADFVTFMPRSIEVSVRVTAFNSLGLQIKRRDPFPFGLVVQKVQDGLIKDWNNANPSNEVDVGHVIVAVCGARGKRQALLDRLVKPPGETLTFHVLDLSTFAL